MPRLFLLEPDQEWQDFLVVSLRRKGFELELGEAARVDQDFDLVLAGVEECQKIQADAPGQSTLALLQGESELPMSTIDQLFWVKRRDTIRELLFQIQLVVQSRSHQQQTRAMLEMSSEGVYVTDLDGGVLYCNSVGATWMREFGPKLLSSPLNEKGEVRLGTRVFKVGRALLQWEGKRARLHRLQEVTLSRNLERKLRDSQQQRIHAQKLEALGRLAGGVAHDFNNILMAILGHAEMLRLCYAEEAEITQGAKSIAAAVRKASRLTQQLLGYARQGKNRHQMVHVHTCLEETERVIGRTFKQELRVRTGLEASKAVIMGDPDQIAQVLLNLALNAADAVAEGGLVEFITSNQETNQGPMLCLEVRDDGRGMPAHIQERVFEPFFTTKPLGESSGMGLATVQGIVENHGGHIRIFSQEGAGTTVVLMLPLAEECSPEHISEISPESASCGRAHLLLVDDEPLIRETACKLLKHFGFSVTEAGSGSEALQLYSADRHDLVILDLVMPGMGGAECFQKLRQKNPDCKVVVVSGFSPKELDFKADGFLMKPFEFGELTAVLEPLLTPV